MVFPAAIREKSQRGVALNWDVQVVSAKSVAMRQPCTELRSKTASCGTFFSVRHFCAGNLERETYPHTNTQTHTHTHTHTRSLSHKHTHTYTHTHTHTHTHTLSLKHWHTSTHTHKRTQHKTPDNISLRSALWLVLPHSTNLAKRTE